MNESYTFSPAELASTDMTFTLPTGSDIEIGFIGQLLAILLRMSPPQRTRALQYLTERFEDGGSF